MQIQDREILLSRNAESNGWICHWTEGSDEPYIANASVVSDVLNMIECGRMGELKSPQIKRLHYYMARPGETVRILVDVLGTKFAYLVGKATIRREVAR